MEAIIEGASVERLMISVGYYGGHREDGNKHPMSAMKEAAKSKSIFDEKYRVVAVHGDRLLVRGVRSGEVLTIINPEPETFLSHEEYPPGKLIALSDPSNALPN